MESVAPVLVAAGIGALHHAAGLAMFELWPELLFATHGIAAFIQPAVAVLLAWGAWRFDALTERTAGWPAGAARYATLAHAGLAFLFLLTPLRYDQPSDWLRLLTAREVSESIAHALITFSITKLLAIRNARVAATCAWVMGGVCVAIAVAGVGWSHPFSRTELLRLVSCTALLVAVACWVIDARRPQPSRGM